MMSPKWVKAPDSGSGDCGFESRHRLQDGCKPSDDEGATASASSPREAGGRLIRPVWTIVCCSMSGIGSTVFAYEWQRSTNRAACEAALKCVDTGFLRLKPKAHSAIGPCVGIRPFTKPFALWAGCFWPRFPQAGSAAECVIDERTVAQRLLFFPSDQFIERARPSNDNVPIPLSGSALAAGFSSHPIGGSRHSAQGFWWAPLTRLFISAHCFGGIIDVEAFQDSPRRDGPVLSRW